MESRPPPSAAATLAFGHADAFAQVHAQLDAAAFEQGARRACAVNAQGSALPLALACVVRPKLEDAFALVDRLSWRTPALPPGGAAAKPAMAVWRYPDAALCQAASLVGLGVKTTWLLGAIGYHLAASAVVAVIYGLQAGRARLEVQAMRVAMQWDQLPPATGAGAQLRRSILEWCLGVSHDDWLADFVRLLPNWAVVLNEAGRHALAQHPCDGLTLLGLRGAAAERQEHKVRAEQVLGAVLAHFIEQAAAAAPTGALPQALGQTFLRVDWPAVHTALERHDDVGAAAALASIDFEYLHDWSQAPLACRRLAEACAAGDAQALQAEVTRMTPLAAFAPWLTQDRLERLHPELAEVRWHSVVAFCRTVDLAGAADVLARHCRTRRGAALCVAFQRARQQQQQQRRPPPCRTLVGGAS